MSANGIMKSLTPPDIQAMKGGEPIVCLTAYTTPIARLMDEHCELVLVGDSLGVVVHGLPSTVGVTMEMMIMHARAVRRGLTRPLMVVDLPFGAYESGPEQAFENAARLMTEGRAGAVKLEGGRVQAETIRFLTERGIPVMAHIGLLPQAINTVGGYKVQGRGDAAKDVLADAKAVAEAGAFAVVLEKVTASIAEKITDAIDIPTIGIGASPKCDGQILVTDDMLGLFEDFQPKFVKRYGNWAVAGREAISSYASDVRARRFPGPEHLFGDQAPGAKKTKN
ncbi:3-methyl-2-oxobutanoate hydroxymethyltransferase [Notoacmeibacter sp. MSK16QG-6]|uniref:3-methyl-2-oxobutanoate hydroxymethyltransferase n=1 Tax=Notoacmeibacter sp. MSK16QG-6 TaxID=2957982 RepID=UPI0020A1557D|nr:3-methyl-2-oxobutanoate hydroxymethyltransferase [Notoacmeibacter sp. MSK16QG-6]MCP1198875.1 3-methyl-2-oxobutanoate hydroxymethyltransferase [Notoacmeibacter sp. MSK16QG-6]